MNSDGLILHNNSNSLKLTMQIRFFSKVFFEKVFFHKWSIQIFLGLFAPKNPTL